MKKVNRNRYARPGGGRRIAAAVLAIALAVVGATARARAAGTSPVLLLTAGDAFSDDAGARLVTASGAFNFDDLVQFSFPAVGLLVVQGARFARYEVSGEVVEGSSPLVADGITPAELPTLLGIGSAAASPVRLVHADRGEVSVVLPADFSAGAASIVLYAHHETEYFVSNAIPVVLP
ncbi:MAG TPA: hypothetical protein VFD92_23945 [Candidatus Binatia bacterium]|nr:hypothetical protein [Candidatus Binatia bacterium]